MDQADAHRENMQKPHVQQVEREAHLAAVAQGALDKPGQACLERDPPHNDECPAEAFDHRPEDPERRFRRDPERRNPVHQPRRPHHQRRAGQHQQRRDAVQPLAMLPVHHRRRHADQELVKPADISAKEHERAVVVDRVRRALEEQQQHQQPREIADALLHREARQERKHQVEDELERNSPRRPGHHRARGRPHAKVGREDPQQLLRFEGVAPDRQRHQENGQEQREDAQDAVAHELAIDDLLLVQRDLHEQETRQREEQADPGVPLGHQRRPRTGQARPAGATIFQMKMEQEHDRGGEPPQLIDARVVLDIGRLHGTSCRTNILFYCKGNP